MTSARRTTGRDPSPACVSLRPVTDRDAGVGAPGADTSARPTGAPTRLTSTSPGCARTRNPDVAKIVRLEPDLVVANIEENRELDVQRLREAGVNVWVTRIETVLEAVRSIANLFDQALGWPRPAWLEEAQKAWDGACPPVTKRVAVPIWRDPWMVVGSGTFTGDLIRRLGWENIFDDATDRYPRTTIDEIEAREPDVVLLRRALRLHRQRRARGFQRPDRAHQRPPRHVVRASLVTAASWRYRPGEL